MTVDELVKLISNEKGEIYPFSYAANMMAAYGVDEKLVVYFHEAAGDVNRASFDRSMILTDYRDGKPYEQARHESFLRCNPHITDGANKAASNDALLAQISRLRAQCNAEITRINQGEGAKTPGFAAINRLLKACDELFAAHDAGNQIDPNQPKA